MLFLWLMRISSGKTLPFVLAPMIEEVFCINSPEPCRIKGGLSSARTLKTKTLSGNDLNLKVKSYPEAGTFAEVFMSGDSISMQS